MPNDDLSVKITKVEGVLPVDLKTTPVPIVARETLPVDVLDFPEDPQAGIPKKLRSGTIHLRTGKKSAAVFVVKETHGLWAYLVPDAEESTKGEQDFFEGWYYLPSLASGPWVDGPAPDFKKHREET